MLSRKAIKTSKRLSTEIDIVLPRFTPGRGSNWRAAEPIGIRLARPSGRRERAGME